MIHDIVVAFIWHSDVYIIHLVVVRYALVRVEFAKQFSVYNSTTFSITFPPCDDTWL